MRVLIQSGQVVLLELRLFETTDPAVPDRVQHIHYHGVDDDDDDNPDEGDMRKLRGEE